MKKRVLSILMVLTLVLGLIPAAMPHAHAEEHTCRDEDGNGLCDSCGYCVGEHSYAWNGVTWSDEGHYVVCSACGHETWELHSDGEDADALCDGCGSCLGNTHNFVWDGETRGDEDHYVVCSICSLETWEPHSDGKDEDALCDVCGSCPEDAHSYIWDGKGKGAAEHSVVCSVCGVDCGWELHSDGKDEDALCDICGNCLADAHNFVWDGDWDSQHHRISCSVCGVYYDWEAHTDADADVRCDVCGYNMSGCDHENSEVLYGETHHWVYCNDCQQVVGREASHSFEDLCYYEDSDKHYRECDGCDYHEPEGEAHSDEDEDGYCDICDYDVIDCDHENSETQYDETHHWTYCHDCERQLYDKTAHSYESLYYYAEADKHYRECDGCEYRESEGEAHSDEDEDGYCDVCDYQQHEHAFEGDYWHGEDGVHYPECDYCSYYDTTRGEACANEDGGHYCDVCGERMSECVDSDPHDHLCDVCDEPTVSGGICSVCGKTMPELTAAYTALSYVPADSHEYGYSFYVGTLEGKVTVGDTPVSSGTVTALWAWRGGAEDSEAFFHTVTVEVEEDGTYTIPFTAEDELWGKALDEACTITFTPAETDDTLTPAVVKYDAWGDVFLVRVWGQGNETIRINGVLDADYFLPGTAITVTLDNGVLTDTVELVFREDGYVRPEDLQQTGNTFTFTMPEGDVLAEAEWTHTACVSQDGNHRCDFCYEQIQDLCTDNDHDHTCDSMVCRYPMEWLCDDGDGDHICDLEDCGRIMAELCRDENDDHTCDVVACGRHMRELCSDGDRNDICDDCGRNLCDHEIFEEDAESDGNGTHRGPCGYCGELLTEDCAVWQYEYDETSHWWYCLCGYEFPAENHSYERNLWNLRSKSGHLIMCDDSYYGSCYYEKWEPHQVRNGVCEICEMQVTDYCDIYVGGVGLENGQYLDNSGAVSTTKPAGGYAYYKDGVLELNDYVHEGGGFPWSEYEDGWKDYAAVYATVDLVLVLKGENSLLPGEVEYENTDGIAAQKSLTIRGDGSLTILAEEDGIQVEQGGLTVESGSIVLSLPDFGEEISDDGCDIKRGDVTISGGSLTINSGDHGFDVEGSVTVTGGTVNVTAGDNGFNLDENFTISGGRVVIDAEDIGLDVSGSVTVSGGIMDIVAENYEGIWTYEGVAISGGSVAIKADEFGISGGEGVFVSDGELVVNSKMRPAVSGERITITGGNLELTAGVGATVFAREGITVEGNAALPEGVTVEEDEGGNSLIVMGSGKTLFITKPFSAELNADGSIRLTNSPWGLKVMFAVYDGDGRMTGVQVVEASGDTVKPTVTGETVMAFFLSSRGAPAHAVLPVK